jgi:hypothetical protein
MEVEMLMEMHPEMTKATALASAKKKKLFIYPSDLFSDKYGKKIKINLEIDDV